ncbi:MAG: glucosidase [Planctomycetes bacterium]|nr:glucosidase [Planctomycetota bacterium]
MSAETTGAGQGGADAGPSRPRTEEDERLAEDAQRTRNWKRWGTYLPERQWGTVREDYSADGNCWAHFPHDHARSRAYRWGEDGLLGFCDREGRLCFAFAFWNGRDPILKERLFGLDGSEGNHGEDVKELYYYLDAAPTHSFAEALYKYPQGEFPYARLVAENRQRGREGGEVELPDLGLFDQGRYFDLRVAYAKRSPEDLLIRLTASNRGPEPATLHVLPTLWFRNTWAWGHSGEGYGPRPSLDLAADGAVLAQHEVLGRYRFWVEKQGLRPLRWLFTENETNTQRLFGVPNRTPYVKDAFHEAVVRGRSQAVNPASRGTKAAAHLILEVPPGGSVVVRCRLSAIAEAPKQPFTAEFEQVLAARRGETERWYASQRPAGMGDAEWSVARQAWAGLLWSKQFYWYSVKEWLEGDPTQPAPPPQRAQGRNADWQHLYNRDVLSVPDKWEYPWYAAWDLAFHMIPFAHLDPHFAKSQLLLFLREWYQHPNGQIPAYEFAFSDVNPPVHAWACWRVYKRTGARGQRDIGFLARAFHKLLINFTWWVNRKDVGGKHLFSGGFLGLDNIGVFDRSKPLPGGHHLQQADGTAWMAFYCATMLAMAVELACHDPTYEDVASKFFEHFVAIADAMNTLGGAGLWDEEDGFYYDQLVVNGGRPVPMRVRSMVGIIPLFAVEVLRQEQIDRLHGFRKRMDWFLANRPDLAHVISYAVADEDQGAGHRLLAIPSRGRLERVLRYVLDEAEFLSPYGVRSLSKVHAARPFVLNLHGTEHRVDYAPGDSTTGLFGGNSNWRGPVWFPLNWLLLEALERYDHFYGESLQVEHPTGSGRWVRLRDVARDLAVRLARIFLPDAEGRRPAHGDDRRYAEDPHFRDLVLFHEFFHGETGRGLGASHQTGWTALVAQCLFELSRSR